MPGSLPHNRMPRWPGPVRALLLPASVIFLVACINPFAPQLENRLVQADLIITEQTTPEEVLQNFRYAYVFRDSLIYSELLDSSFVFFYFDPNIGTSGQLVSWGRDLDLKTTGSLFRRFNIIDLVWNSTIYESVQELTGEITKTFNLTMLARDDDVRISGTAVFSFRRNSASGKWKITKWKDESNL